MTKVSFKKFASYVDLSEDLSDEQICEIFGLFKNNKSETNIEKIKAARAKLTADQVAQKKAADDKIKQMRQTATGQDQDGLSKNDKLKADSRNRLNHIPSNQMRASQSRAAEYGWALGENVSTDAKIAPFRIIFQEILKDLDKTGGKYYYKVFNKPSSKSEKLARSYLENMYSEISTEKHLHPDDDFEKIEALLFKELKKMLK